MYCSRHYLEHFVRSGNKYHHYATNIHGLLSLDKIYAILFIMCFVSLESDSSTYEVLAATKYI